MIATCSLLAAAMLPGASTMREEEYFNEEDDKFSAEFVTFPPLLDFLDFFTEVTDDFVVLLGVTTLSTLEFNPLGSFPLLVAGCRGDFSLGDAGGVVVTEALILGLLFPPVLLVIVAPAGADDGNGCNGVLEEFVEDFFRELRLSKRGVRLQFG